MRLEPAIFYAVRQTALSEWRKSVASFGLDISDKVLDFRFADDLSIVCKIRARCLKAIG